jgi:hypothetical protein
MNGNEMSTIRIPGAAKAHGASPTPRRAVWAAGASAVALLLAEPALAADPASAAGAPAEQTGGAEVVTANKLNATKVLETAAAIQAISGAALTRAGDVGFIDEAGKIPGLSAF